MIDLRDVITRTPQGFAPNMAFATVTPYTIGFDPQMVPNPPFALPAASAASKAIGFQAPRASQFGMFEAYYAMYADSTDTTAAAAWTVDFPNFQARPLNNSPLHIRTFAGTAQLPALIREPLVMFSREKLIMQPQKISGAGANIWTNFAGVQWNPYSGPLQDFIAKRMAKWQTRRQYVWPFWLTTLPVSISANSVNQNYDVQLSEHFEAFSISAVATGAFSMELTEIRSGKTISNGVFTMANALGDATLPTIFDTPYLVPAGSRLRFTFNDLSSGTNVIYVTMAGRKILPTVPIQEVRDVLADTDVLPPADALLQTFPEMVGAM